MSCRARPAAEAGRTSKTASLSPARWLRLLDAIYSIDLFFLPLCTFEFSN
jgi:hypothetical protein